MKKRLSKNEIKELTEHDKFVEKLRVFPYSAYGIKKVYAIVNKTANGEIIVSLINDVMLDVDYEYFSSNHGTYKEYYVPYIYEFVVKESDKEKILSITNYAVWYNAVLSENIVYTNATNMIEGTLHFSASVFNPKKVYLEFIDKVDVEEYGKILKSSHEIKTMRADKKINHIQNIRQDYYSKSYEPFSKEVQKEISKDNYINIDVYNVGQGNFVYIKGDKNRILFDVGIDKNTTYYDSKIKSIIQKIKPNAIILSHWDLDHILGVKFIKDEDWPNIWIAPDIIERKGDIILSAHRLAMYLLKNEYLHMIGKKYSGKMVYELKNMKIYKGDIIAKYAKKSANDNNNNHGLIITIETDNFNTILPGDCEFAAWPEKIAINKVPYDILMLPHHGAEVYLPEKKEYDSLFMLGVVSYGENNTYGHPANKIMRQLKDIYKCDIVETPNYDEIKIKICKNHIELICIDNIVGFRKWMFKSLERYHIVKSDNSGVCINDII